MAKDCKSVTKVSFVGAPYGCGTLCILAPGRNDIVIFDQFEASEDKSEVKSKVGLPNRHLLNWSYKLGKETNFRVERIPLVTGRGRIDKFEDLPNEISMYEWEMHGILEARAVMDRATGDFSAIGLVVDNLGKKYVHNITRDEAKDTLKVFLKKAYEEDAFCYTAE